MLYKNSDGLISLKRCNGSGYRWQHRFVIGSLGPVCGALLNGVRHLGLITLAILHNIVKPNVARERVRARSRADDEGDVYDALQLTIHLDAVVHDFDARDALADEVFGDGFPFGEKGLSSSVSLHVRHVGQS